jgi:hypothetical protein
MIGMKQIMVGAFAGIVAIAAPFINAEDTDEHEVASTGPNPFSDCGIGAAIFTETKWAAVTSNIIWDLGITGTTSATASPETCKGKRVETAKFIIENYDNLAEETAKGEGTHLVAMLGVLGCEESAHSAIITTVRQSMTEVVSQPSYVDQDLVKKSSDYYDAVTSAVDGEFASSCSA